MRYEIRNSENISAFTAKSKIGNMISANVGYANYMWVVQNLKELLSCK